MIWSYTHTENPTDSTKKCLSLHGLFHVAQCPPDSSVLPQTAGFPSYGWTVFHLSIYCVFFIRSSFGGYLAFLYSGYCEECDSEYTGLILFLSGTYPEVRLLYHVVVLVLIKKKKCVFWLCWVFTVALRLSLVVVHGLSGPEACGILVPRPGSKPRPLRWRVDSSPPGHQGRPWFYIFEKLSHCFP